MKTKKYFNEGLRYLLFFSVTAVVCLLLEVLVAMIPQTVIQKNMEKSALFYYERQSREFLIRDIDSTILDYYADTILLNVVYGIDEDSPWESIIADMYFDVEQTNANIDLMEVVFQDKEPNVSYGRYWHGSMVWLRPLLCIMSVAGIYNLYAFLTVTTVTGLVIWSIRQKKYKAAISFLGAFILSGGLVTWHCLEYGNTILLMLVMVPLFIICNQKGDRQLYKISIICGVLTCFTDFLTAELLTITVPLLFLCIWTHDENKGRMYEKKYIKATILWGISYVGMFLAKWFLLAMHFGYEGFADNFLRTKDHIQGNPLLAIIRNIGILAFGEKYDSVNIKIVTVILLGIIILGIFMWRIKDIETGRKMNMLLLALLPYVRYACISSHSMTHYFFTYRAQMVTVMLLFFGILNINLNKKQGIIG